MQKHIKILFSLLLLLSLGSCSDDFQWQGIEVAEDEYLIGFEAAPSAHVDVATRYGTESDTEIRDLSLLMTDGSKLLCQPAYFTSDDMTNWTKPSDSGDGTIKLKRSKTADGTWYLVANAKVKINSYLVGKNISSISLSDLLAAVKYDAKQLNGEEVCAMIASTKIEVFGQQTQVPVFPLERIFSKVTVAVNPANTTKLPFAMTRAGLSRRVVEGNLAGNYMGSTVPAIGTATSSDAIAWDAPVSGGTEVVGGVTAAKKGARIILGSYPFAPEENAATTEEMMVIIEGYYNQSGDVDNPSFGTDPCYYAVVLPKLEANHHYELLINGAPAPGKASPEEAEANPGGLSVTFSDKTETIHNIISDGENVLAVPDTITIPADATSVDFLVRARRGNDKTAELEITGETPTWLNAMNPSAWTTTTTTPTTNESKNKLKTTEFAAKVTAKGANKGSERTATYNVKLVGTELERTVVVRHEANTHQQYSDAMKISLKISGNGINESIQDYLRFINPSISNSTSGPECKGIAPECNGSRQRNMGIHMPMPNGGANYEYKIELNSGWTITGVEDWTKSGNVYTKTFSDEAVPAGGDHKYSYVNEADQIVISNSDGSITYTLDLYHCGFFHLDGSNWLYYEVVQQGNKDLFWLDRNLGATSAGMDVKSNGSYLNSSAWPIRNGAAAGGKYTNTDYKASCPKGWDLPSYQQLRSLTLESGFAVNRLQTSPARVGYYAPGYLFSVREFGTQKGITTYFPTNNYGSDEGENETGYYLTNTGAGTANWYQVVLFQGRTVTSANMLVTGRPMSVRLCAGDYDPATQAVTYSCSVKGYTHVFMYIDNGNGTKTWLNTWPGEVVAVSSDVDRFHPFSITPPMEVEDSKLRVIFNYVENGVVKKSNVSEANRIARNGIEFVNGGYYDIAHTPVAPGAETGGWSGSGQVTTVEYEYAVKGGFNGGWSVKSPNPMAKSGNTYTATINVTNLTAAGNQDQFVIVRRQKGTSSWTDYYKPNVKPTTVTYDTDMPCYTNQGMDFNWKLTKLGSTTFTLKVTETGATIRVSTSGGGGGDVSGYAFGIRGLLWGQSGDSWSTKIMTETSSGSGIWELKNVQVYANRDFGIGGYTKNTNYQDDSNQKAWYEASSGNATVKNGVSKTLQSSSGAKLQMEESGIYDFTFNEITKEFIATKRVTGDPSDNMYLVGTHNGWNADDNSKMYTTDGITYTITVPNMGTDNFKFNGGAWGTREFGSGREDALGDGTYNLTGKDKDFHLSKGGNVTFTLVKTDSNWATCKVTIKHND